MTDGNVKQVEQQMLAARPWEAAEDGSIWSISGEYPSKGGTFTDCLAVVLPRFVTDSDQPVFHFIGPLALPALNQLIDTAWITHATPLLLVHRDEPETPYWEHDREWMREATS